MNRSIQAEGTFGIIKYDRWYKRIVRRGLNSVRLELLLVIIFINSITNSSGSRKQHKDKKNLLLWGKGSYTLLRVNIPGAGYHQSAIGYRQTGR